ncbi:unnamed protein product [Ectocarpus sp. 13 AM-2016]
MQSIVGMTISSGGNKRQYEGTMHLIVSTASGWKWWSKESTRSSYFGGIAPFANCLFSVGTGGTKISCCPHETQDARGHSIKRETRQHTNCAQQNTCRKPNGNTPHHRNRAGLYPREQGKLVYYQREGYLLIFRERHHRYLVLPRPEPQALAMTRRITGAPRAAAGYTTSDVWRVDREG